MDVHILNSLFALGSLKQVISKTDKCFAIGDCLQFGPLADGRKRAEFLDETLGTGDISDDDAFDRWREIRGDIASLSPQRIIIWSSRTNTDILFLATAAHFFADAGFELWNIQVLASDDFPSVDVRTPDELRANLPLARQMGAEELAGLRGAFESYAANPAVFRIADANGVISFRGADYYDDALLSHCSSDWAKAAYVIGLTMGYGDPLNPVGDLILAWRLRELIARGRLEAQGDPTQSIRDYAVRLPNPLPAP